MTPALCLTGAGVLRPEGWEARGALSLAGGRIIEGGGRAVDLSGFWLLPGVVDLHGDGFERHLAPRRGALLQTARGLPQVEAELAANGITTAYLAQFYSWEGGLRGPEFAHRFLTALAGYTSHGTDLRAQLRFETHMLEDYAAVEALVAEFDISYLVFNDHLPHARVAKGKTPPGHVGRALKAGKNPERFWEEIKALAARAPEVPEAVTALAARLSAQGLHLGSHDDGTAETRAGWQARGVKIAEFPETLEAAEAPSSGVIMGAPNVMRGNSHAGNIAATDLIRAGLCDALASDYHYPAPLAAIFALEERGLCSFAEGWRLVSEGPARLIGLSDRGALREGLRADLIAIDPETRRVGLTIAGGRITHASGLAAARLAAG